MGIMLPSLRVSEGMGSDAGMIEAVFFDLGDTIIHFETSNASAILDMMCRAGYHRLLELGHRPPAYPAYLRAIKRRFFCEWFRSKLVRREIRLVRCVERLHVAMGFALESDELAEIVRGLIIPAMEELATVDDEAKDMLAQLARPELKLGLVSNTPFPGFAIDAYLDGKGLLDHFPIRVYSSEVGFLKPQPQIFQHALDQVGVPAQRVLFVGDRIDNDIRGAARVGMKTMLFTHGEQISHSRVRPDHMIQRLSELPAILKELTA